MGFGDESPGRVVASSDILSAEPSFAKQFRHRHMKKDRKGTEMNRTLPQAGFLLALAMLAVSSAGFAQDRLQLVENDVVVFMGGANMLHLQQDGHLEAILSQEFAALRPKFRDLSWEADTVFQQGTVIERWRETAHFNDLGGLGDLNRQLERLGATVVIAQFGALESLRGAESLVQFTEAYEKLVDTLQKHARTVVLMTPTPFEKPPSPLIPDLTPRNADLARIVESIKTIAARRKLVFVDLFTAAKPGLTDNGMHVALKARVHLADEIARQLGIGRPALRKKTSNESVRTLTEKREANFESLRQAVVEKYRLWYDYWRPANWKLIYGDDARRQFTRGGEHHISFQEEWQTLVPLIDRAEQRVWQIASGGEDPGPNRPAPEKLHGDPSANVAQELASFETTDDLHVNLFASEREGLTSPLAIRWDPAGRAYVTVTTTYPHVIPGDLPNDKVILLEDTDGDGVADKSTVFAEGLNIPTGLEWGEGGLFVGQNTEILFLKDTDGDGRADSRRVVLGGFGNGDSHQTINSFRWSPDGELYFGHGDGCESRVETPWGARNLFDAGFYRFRPRRLQLLPFLENHMGPGNPWGIEFGEWGQAFNVDGAGGVNWLNPGRVSTSHVSPLKRIGDPGGYCGIGYLDGRHLPESMHGDFVTGDFKQNRVKRFSVLPSESGFVLDWKEPILRSRHRNFRPVDVKVGPDGAIYVVDWYNPITCHQDDAYRVPTRDKAHGRIWRISSKNSPIHPPNLEATSIADVVESLRSSEYWTRYQAKREMTRRDSAQVAEALNRWVRTLDPKDTRYEHLLVEAIGAYATIEVVEPKLLNRLLNARDPRARAFAVHLVGRWHDRLNTPLDLLEERITDEHPQVRLEAVVACSEIPSARSIETAARVLDKPADNWIEYAFKQTIHGLKSHWLPAFQRGDSSFARPDHLAAVLNETGGGELLDHLKRLVDSENLNAATRARAIAAILATGGPEELRDYGLDTMRFTRTGEYDAAAHASVLSRLVDVAQHRDVRPAGNLATLLGPLADHAQPDVQSSALELAGRWKVNELQAKVVAVANDKSAAISARAAAFQAMADMKVPDSREMLVAFSGKTNLPVLRSFAITSLAIVDLPAAAEQAAEFFGESDPVGDPAPLLDAFLNRTGGAQALADALRARQLPTANAKNLLRALFSAGRSDAPLLAALNSALGSTVEPPDYSDNYVRQLVTDASKKGVPQRGSLLFKSMACSSCHKVSGAGGNVGPDLTAIGTTLSSERIVEELLWPNRQIKEGFSVVQVVTTDGKILQGYERTNRAGPESSDLVIEDPATGKLTTISKQDIEEKRITGSPMPTGLTALLSENQLLDLIQYLTELGRIQ